MRLSRTSWLVLGIGIFVIVLATLCAVYSRQSSEQEGLKNSLATAETQLTKFISEREALANQLTRQQSQLAETQSSLSNAQASFPESVPGIEYDEVLSEIAHARDLEVMSMEAEEPREEEEEGITYTVISFKVEVRGAVAGICGMVSDIATDERLISTTVKVLEIVVPQATCPLAEPQKPSATIEFVGYSYGGE